MFENIKKLLKRTDYYSIPLPEGYDPGIFSEVIARAISPEQQTRVLRTSYHLTQLWKYGNTVHIPRVIIKVEAAYPHLELMADLEIFSTDWLAELTKVMQLTADSAIYLVSQPEQFRQLLHEAIDNIKPD